MAQTITNKAKIKPNQYLSTPKKKFRSRKLTIAVSILDIDFCQLKSVIDLLNHVDIDMLHYDVMDGTFVTNISFGTHILGAIKRHLAKPVDVHLMVNDPVVQFRQYQKSADLILFHFESVYYREIHNLLLDIKINGRKAGIAISPKTNVEQIFEYCINCDEVLVMGVIPGKGGQTFIPKTIKKIKKLRSFLDRTGITKQVTISVDGGINYKTAKMCILAGASKIVVGNSFFASTNQGRFIEQLRTLAK